METSQYKRFAPYICVKKKREIVGRYEIIKNGYFSIKSYVLTIYYKRLNEVILKDSHNI